MQQYPAQQNAANRQVGHALFEVLEVLLHQFELGRCIIHLYTNYLIQYILSSEYIIRKHRLAIEKDACHFPTMIGAMQPRTAPPKRGMPRHGTDMTPTDALIRAA